MSPIDSAHRRATIVVHAVMGILVGVMFLADTLVGRIARSATYKDLPLPALWFSIPVLFGVVVLVGLDLHRLRVLAFGLGGLAFFYYLQCGLFLIVHGTLIGPVAVYGMLAVLLSIQVIAVFAQEMEGRRIGKEVGL